MRLPLAHLLPLALLALTGLGGPAAAGSAPVSAHLAEPDRLEHLGRRNDTQDGPRQPTAAKIGGGWPARIEARLAELENEVTLPLRAGEVAPPTDALALELDRLVRIASRASEVAITVRELDTGAVVFDHRGDEALNPASNHKILTAVAAVELLGADYRFETRVARHDDALYVVGEGDPSLQLDDLLALATEVASRVDLAGVARIVVDDSAFSSRRFGPGYDEEGPGYSYMAPSGALSLQFNTLEIEVRSTTAGDPVDVRVSPACEHVEVRSEAMTARRGWPRVETRAEGRRTVVDVMGRLGRRSGPVRLRRRISDPGRFAGTTFAALLAEAMSAPEPLPVERGSLPKEATQLTLHRSAPLAEVLASALKFSNNFTTEQVLRTLGWRMTGDPGDWENGARALERFWEAVGEDPGDLSFENASGLSRRGRVTARALVDLLSLTIDDERDAADLWSSMPIAGREGTLRQRLRSTSGRVRAKTGTLHGASALSGVIVSRTGEPHLGFSILLNGRLDARRSRRIQDRVVMALLHHLD